MKKYYVTWGEDDLIFGTYDTPHEAGFAVGVFILDNPEYPKEIFRLHRWAFSNIDLD